MYYTLEERKTNWEKMNRANRNKANLPKNVGIFQIGLDHGQTPVNDSYGYVVYTGSGTPASMYPFHVLRNDTLIQAVQSLDRQTVEAVFYRSGILQADRMSLAVSAPCTVLIQNVDGLCTMVVTDAEMNPKRKEIVVTFNGKIIPVKMPQGEWCGKPVAVSICMK